MDASTLVHSVEAIATLRDAGVMGQKAAKASIKVLIQKINECMTYWSDKEQWDVVEGLNAAYKKAVAL